MKKNYNKDT